MAKEIESILECQSTASAMQAANTARYMSYRTGTHAGASTPCRGPATATSTLSGTGTPAISPAATSCGRPAAASGSHGHHVARADSHSVKPQRTCSLSSCPAPQWGHIEGSRIRWPQTCTTLHRAPVSRPQQGNIRDGSGLCYSAARQNNELKVVAMTICLCHGGICELGICSSPPYGLLPVTAVFTLGRLFSGT